MEWHPWYAVTDVSIKNIRRHNRQTQQTCLSDSYRPKHMETPRCLTQVGFIVSLLLTGKQYFSHNLPIQVLYHSEERTWRMYKWKLSLFQLKMAHIETKLEQRISTTFFTLIRSLCWSYGFYFYLNKQPGG